MGASLTAEDKKHDSSCESSTASARGAWGDRSPATDGSCAGAPSGMPLFLQPQVQMKCAGCEESSRTEEPPEKPVQKKCAECEAEEAGHASAAGASGGVAAANRTLPHSDRIQASFGHHDISDARAAVGGDAATANRNMGSLAYTSGDRVAFRSEPDVNLAAHEAAHVVQQRNGAKLPDGVERPGDPYERQADEAAKAVEHGESAEPILDHRVGGGGGSGIRVQHQLEVDSIHLTEPPVRSTVIPEGDTPEPSPGAGSRTATKEEVRPPKNDDNDPQTDDGKGGKRRAGARPRPGPGAAPDKDGNGAKPCTGGGVAKCYREPDDPPPDDYNETPKDQPQNKVDAKSDDSADPDAPEPDDCPAQETRAGAPEAKGASAGPAQTGAKKASAPQTAGSKGKTPAPKGTEKIKAAKPKDAGGAQTPAADAGAPSPIAASIGAIEGQRNAAVASYGTSAAALGGAAQGTPLLRAPVRFAPASGETNEQSHQREGISASVQAFFSGIADRIDSAIAFALGLLPDQIGNQAEAAKARIVASVETEKSAISASANRSRIRARAGAAGAKRAVSGQAASFVAAIHAQSSAALAALTAAHGQSMGQVDATETSSLGAINQIHSEGRIALEGLGPQVGGECTAIGEQFAATYRTFRNCTEDHWYDGNLSERRANAQADAAIKTAATYHDRIVEGAKKRAKEIARDSRKSYRCSIIGSARQSRDLLDHTLSDLTHAIESARDASIQQTQGTLHSLLSGIDSGLAATQRQIDKTEHEQRQLIDDTGYMQQMMQEQIAHSGAAALQHAVSGAAGMLKEAMLSLQDRLSGGRTPDPEQLKPAIATVAQTIAAAMDGLQTALDNGATRVASQLSGAAAAAVAALDGVVDGALDGLKDTTDGFTTSMRTLAGTDNFAAQRADFSKQMARMGHDGSAALTKIASGFKDSCDAAQRDSRKALEKAGIDLEASLRQQKIGIECEITKAADEAASHEAPAWKKVLAVFLIIIVIVIVIVVTVATAGAGLGLLAVVAIGAAVGAVTSALITMASNLWNNRPTLHGVAQAALMGAVTGAIGGGIGFAVGAGVGAVAQGLTKGAQIAAQYAAAMVTAAALNTGQQYITNKGSFENFSWGNLGLTLLITAATLGLSHYSPQIKTGLGFGGGVPPTPGPVPEPVPLESGAPSEPLVEPTSEPKPDASVENKPPAGASGNGKPPAEGPTPTEPVEPAPATPTSAEPTTKPPTESTPTEPVPPKPSAPEAHSTDAPVKPGETTPVETPPSESAPAEAPTAGQGTSEEPAASEPAPTSKEGAPVTPEEQEVLGQTASKNSQELTPEEALTEKAVADRTAGKPIDEPPFTSEHELPNSHDVKETPTDDEFERCSKFCAVFDKDGDLITEEQEEGTPHGDAAERSGGVAHDVGVQQGRELLAGEGMSPDPEWANPFENIGSHGQGFDDVLIGPDGEPVIAEYKGGSAELSDGQMERPWVQRNINRIRDYATRMRWPEMIAYADKLQTSLDSGKLTGVAVSTPIDPVTGAAEPVVVRRWTY